MKSKRNRSRIWGGLAAATLLLSLAACGEDPAGSPAAESSASSEDVPLQQEPAEDYAIDECLVGVWTTVSQREEATVGAETVILIDVERQLTFSSDGTETVTFLDTPAMVQSPAGEVLGEVVHSGELTYQVSTDEPGTISFEVTAGELSADFTIRGQRSALTSNGASGPVSYSCSARELSQSSAGYEAVFTRAV